MLSQISGGVPAVVLRLTYIRHRLKSFFWPFRRHQVACSPKTKTTPNWEIIFLTRQRGRLKLFRYCCFCAVVIKNAVSISMFIVLGQICPFCVRCMFAKMPELK